VTGQTGTSNGAVVHADGGPDTPWIRMTGLAAVGGDDMTGRLRVTAGARASDSGMIHLDVDPGGAWCMARLTTISTGDMASWFIVTGQARTSHRAVVHADGGPDTPWIRMTGLAAIGGNDMTGRLRVTAGARAGDSGMIHLDVGPGRTWCMARLTTVGAGDVT